MSKRYRLSKDTIGNMAGNCWVIESGEELTLIEKGNRYITKSGWYFDKSFVEAHPEWFELIPEPSQSPIIEWIKKFKSRLVKEQRFDYAPDIRDLEKILEQSHQSLIPDNRPPLGIMPEWRWKELRLEEIRQAMIRFNEYHNSKKHCPQEWLDEKHELENWLSKRNELKFSKPTFGGIRFFDEAGKHSGLATQDNSKERIEPDWEGVVKQIKMTPHDKYAGKWLKEQIEIIHQRQMDKAREDTWVAAKATIPDPSGIAQLVFKYPTLESYLMNLKNNNNEQGSDNKKIYTQDHFH